MKSLFGFLMMGFLLAQPVLAAANHKINEPFEMVGLMTNFYGGPKSAEANMWEKALKVCQDLSVGQNNGLLLNRLSEVEYEQLSTSTSTATATFVCVPSGLGE